MGTWFLHMLTLGVISDCEVATAMASAEPFTDLQALYVTSCTRLAESLNAQVHRYAHGHGDEFRAAFEIGLGPIHEEQDPSITLRIEDIYRFEVPSLHQTPPTLAAWVCESFELISLGLVPCILPREMWTGEISGGADFYREEYDALKSAVDVNDMEAMTQYVENNDLFHFGGYPATLTEQLCIARQTFEEQPSWMKSKPPKAPIKHAEQLHKQAADYAAIHGPHPWCSYVQEVCSALTRCYRNDRDLSRQQKVLTSLESLFDRQEMEAPLLFALWIDSGSECEKYHAQGVYDNMSQAGEEPTNHYSLTALSSTQLRRLLNHSAIGMGLLLRAAAIDEQMCKSSS